ncbi:putative apyrase 7 [Dorcoceras hygrometricum]|uniref:Putative apyrase 7 n=1 Tax=Dorcoceras hygrometricum TaxID=472368 RepID=A0A2Z7CLN1_9LAMI|nr:putative apyrase 7 [Dorcoceras hygrometricum]
MNTYFTVVLDCGSTGSRVNVYEWKTNDGNKDYGKLPILLRSYPQNINQSNGCEYHCMQTEPGLHNSVHDGFKVRASLEPLIRYAEQWVPLKRHSVTPIMVFATAGMRRLTVEDTERILKNVENVVKEHGFLFRKSWIRVLTGKEEAYFGWVALNYQMGVFRSSLMPHTLGLLDIGGSSLQVVAEVDVSLKGEHEFRTKLGPYEYDIAAYSLPAFGLNEAFGRTINMLSHTQALRESGGGMFEVGHPCLGSGFFQNHSCFGVDPSNSRNVSNQVRDNELNSLLLVGEPNWEQCKLIARSAAINSSSSDWSHQVHRSNCVGLANYGGNTELNLSKTSPSVTRYHALSGFFAVSHALNLSQRANLTMLWELGDRLCSNPSTDQTSMTGLDCFHLPYLASLIQNALCLNRVEIIFGPGNVTWTLGASLIEGEFLWIGSDKSKSGILSLFEHNMIFSPLFTFLLLLLLLLIVYYSQIKLPMLGRKRDASRTSVPFYLYPTGRPID